MLRTRYADPQERVPLFDTKTRAFLEGGCSLLVGTVSPDGEPHASRGWGLDVLDDGEVAIVRVLLDARDPATIANLASGGAVAITAADVRTLRSIQLKGRSLGTEPPTPGDAARADRYCDAFMVDIIETDGTPRDLLERIVPGGYVPCRVAVEDRFVQTPGPGAGARIDPS